MSASIRSTSTRSPKKSSSRTTRRWAFPACLQRKKSSFSSTSSQNTTRAVFLCIKPFSLFFSPFPRAKKKPPEIFKKETSSGFRKKIGWAAYPSYQVHQTMSAGCLSCSSNFFHVGYFTLQRIYFQQIFFPPHLQSALETQRNDFRLSKVRWKLKKMILGSPKCFGMSKKSFSVRQSSLEGQKRDFRLSKVRWKVKKKFFGSPKFIRNSKK